MDKSLDEIIGSKQTPAGVSKNSRPRRRRAPQNKSGGNKNFKALYIKNLADAITEDDLRDLFRQVGPVVKVVIDRNDAGDRSGQAWVLYDFSEDALVAQERFNQRKAAGRTITVRRVSRVGDSGTHSVSLEERIGESLPRRKNKSRSGGRKRESRPRNAEDLDAELDAYMQVESEIQGKDQTPAEIDV